MEQLTTRNDFPRTLETFKHCLKTRLFS